MSEELETGRAVYDRAQALAFPRYPGTEGDRRAISIVRTWFEAAGLEVSEESFDYDVRPAFRALRVLLLSGAAMVGASAIVASRHSGWALLLLAVTLGSSGALLGWAPWLERLYRRPGPTRTANVVGRRPGVRASKAPRLRLILMAHHDSKSQSLTLPYRMGCTLGAILGVLGLAGAEFAAAIGLPLGGLYFFVPAALAVVALVVLSTLRSGNESPGGVDNAGSVAILVELAEALARQVPRDVDLVFLSPGAEEDHMVGAMRWLDRHAGELARAPLFAINIDGAGIPGRVVLLERYGLGRRFSAKLSRIARQAAVEQGVRVRGSMLPPAMGIDAIPFAHRGMDSLTLASGSLGPAVFAVHSRHDHGTNLAPQALDEVTRLVKAIVLLLAAERSAQVAVGPESR